MLRERLAGKVEIFNMASTILKEKVPVEYSDTELNILSQAIESVNLAEMAMRRELKAKRRLKPKRLARLPRPEIFWLKPKLF